MHVTAIMLLLSYVLQLLAIDMPNLVRAVEAYCWMM